MQLRNGDGLALVVVVVVVFKKSRKRREGTYTHFLLSNFIAFTRFINKLRAEKNERTNNRESASGVLAFSVCERGSFFAD